MEQELQEQEQEQKRGRGRPPRPGAKSFNFRLPVDLVEEAMRWGAANGNGMGVGNSAIIEALIRRGLGR